LKFVDDPEVSLEAEAISFLDYKYNIEKLADGQPVVMNDLIQEAKDFKGVDPQPTEDNPDVQRSEATIMEGFRYRIASDISPFPVFNGREDVSSKFPVLPIGMMDLWRKDEEDLPFWGTL